MGNGCIRGWTHGGCTHVRKNWKWLHQNLERSWLYVEKVNFTQSFISILPNFGSGRAGGGSQVLSVAWHYYHTRYRIERSTSLIVSVRYFTNRYGTRCSWVLSENKPPTIFKIIHRYWWTELFPYSFEFIHVRFSAMHGLQLSSPKALIKVVFIVGKSFKLL
jgi:hypothetical protein